MQGKLQADRKEHSKNTPKVATMYQEKINLKDHTNQCSKLNIQYTNRNKSNKLKIKWKQ